MFQNGAEAIAINGNRLGAQTSIRKAGGHILIGMTAIQSPYTIEAIGDRAFWPKRWGRKTCKVFTIPSRSRYLPAGEQSIRLHQGSSHWRSEVRGKGRIMAAVLGLIIGVVIGVFVKPDIRSSCSLICRLWWSLLLTPCWVPRAYFERSFSDRVFVIPSSPTW